MEQDVNKIMDILNSEWVNDMIIIKKRIAILQEENGRLKEEVENLKEKENAD